MSNFRVLGRKCVATVATVATNVASRVATLFPHCSNTVATLFSPMVRRISPSKSAFYSRICSNSSNTFANSSQKNAFEGEDYSRYEYDHNDYDEWFEGESEYWEYEHNSFPPWYAEGQESDSIWERAVDEIIDNEEPGQYPPGFDPRSGDIPF